MNVKKIIKKKGYTIEKVAEMMGITRVTLAQNLSRNPTIGTLQKIANAIGCNVGDFFSDELKIEKPELTALIRFRGQLYQADTIEELKEVVKMIEEKIEL